ncbi:uncharacterized protein LOC117172833 [Belonocnema kinseyi]|uniref:uncharacterized protein LOC117172833 n=1 Tax=Belonocnema kinseyi TaxID=2817044 RepID=UPI00143DAACD|nr:uncharacterized protein LOC117172833 [Belonocnema kinseyi]XP_033216970.1 uncharacterized protein LOC117172833 [Belonocnema kinseyi]
MSTTNPKTRSFRNVNGDKVTLEVKNERENQVMTFVFRHNDSMKIGSEAMKCCLFLAAFFIVNNWIFTLIFGAVLLSKCISFATSVTTDTLLVMESVGVQIVSKRRLFGLDTTEFLPWNTIQNIFINEVIIERRVLNYLTFIVEDTHQEKEAIRLVPLFREIKPERKCLELIFNHLAVFIKPDKKS